MQARTPMPSASFLKSFESIRVVKEKLEESGHSYYTTHQSPWARWLHRLIKPFFLAIRALLGVIALALSAVL